jgi:hypothetical protein
MDNPKRAAITTLGRLTAMPPLPAAVVLSSGH